MDASFWSVLVRGARKEPFGVAVRCEGWAKRASDFLPMKISRHPPLLNGEAFLCGGRGRGSRRFGPRTPTTVCQLGGDARTQRLQQAGGGPLQRNRRGEKGAGSR